MNLNEYARVCHKANDQWWRDPRTGERINRNKGELLMLIVSEVAAAVSLSLLGRSGKWRESGVSYEVVS